MRPFSHDLEKSLHFADVVRFRFFIHQLGRFCEQYRVPRKVPAAHGFVERVADRAVNVVGGARGRPVALHLGVELFDVLGFQLVEPVRTDSGDEVNAHVHAVSGMRVLRDVRRNCDVLHPKREPCGNAPALANLRHATFIPELFESADFRGHFRFCLPPYVPTVWAAIVFDAYGHAAMPAFGVFVDAGSAIRVSSHWGYLLSHAAADSVSHAAADSG
ncbi:MAG: hypothetical protein ACLQB1_24700 [Streptosporangiaceae bacterium]